MCWLLSLLTQSKIRSTVPMWLIGPCANCHAAPLDVHYLCIYSLFSYHSPALSLLSIHLWPPFCPWNMWRFCELTVPSAWKLIPAYLQDSLPYLLRSLHRCHLSKEVFPVQSSLLLLLSSIVHTLDIVYIYLLIVFHTRIQLMGAGFLWVLFTFVVLVP